ncbi:MAG: transposase [Moorea sp. SIO3H5]|nr:transposase [Moorena sp. SIO3H5]NEO69733.1 transposase [Moorena sp. SIO3H5]
MIAKKSQKIIRTDQWSLKPSAPQQLMFAETISIYQRACKFLTSILFTHWDTIGSLDTKEAVTAVERLMHQTKKNPNPKYKIFNRVFYKLPSYYRRAAIAFSLGQVSSFVTRYRDWQCGQSRKRRDAKPPLLTMVANCYPALYQGQCYRLDSLEEIQIKVLNGKNWVWTTVGIVSTRNRHTIPANKQLSPSLIQRNGKAWLSVPFHCKPDHKKEVNRVVGVDLGINKTAVISVVESDGTVIYREFIHPGRDIDRRDKKLKSVSRKASKTMGKGGRLHKGFCRNTYRKCRHINRQIAQIVSKGIVEISIEYNVSVIAFEYLKNWKPKGGKKKSNLKQRFHGWLKSIIRELTEMKWIESGGKIHDVVARGTSSNAYDGSGTVWRDRKNYALARFSNGKRYNADLSASYNIAARAIQELTRRNDSENRSSKSSTRLPRSRAVLCDLWVTSNDSIGHPHLKQS